MNQKERTLGRGKRICKGLKVDESSGMWRNEGSACGISNPEKEWHTHGGPKAAPSSC